MTTSSYIIAWLIYLLAASGTSFMAWHLSRHWQTTTQYAIRTSLLVMLFTPYFSNPEQDKFAPAILVSLFELVFGEHQMGLKAASPLLMLLAVSNILVLAYVLIRRKMK
jgi:hypothetical protein